MTTFTVTAEIALHEGGVGDRDLRVPIGSATSLRVADLAIDTPIDAAAAQRVFAAWLGRGCRQMTPREVERLLAAGGR